MSPTAGNRGDCRRRQRHRGSRGRAGQWVAALRRLAEDDALAEKFRANARRWVEEDFDAHKNAARLLQQFEATITQPRTP